MGGASHQSPDMEPSVYSLSFAIGGPEIIVILVLLMLLAAPVVLVLVLLKVFSKPKLPPALPETRETSPADEGR